MFPAKRTRAHSGANIRRRKQEVSALNSRDCNLHMLSKYWRLYGCYVHHILFFITILVIIVFIITIVIIITTTIAVIVVDDNNNNHSNCSTPEAVCDLALHHLEERRDAAKPTA
jgi:hypothetical protein